MIVQSPYLGKETSEWAEITENVIKEHPLSEDEIVQAVLDAWDDIFNSKIGSAGLSIGVDLTLSPQQMANFLHKLIPLHIAKVNPEFCEDKTGFGKDIECTSDPLYSIELKTSSSTKNFYGNRSYAQEQVDGSLVKKSKSGYYLIVNFGKFTEDVPRPAVSLIRFGWIDSADWKGQDKQTGQQSTTSADVQKYKLKTLYPKSSA